MADASPGLENQLREALRAIAAPDGTDIVTANLIDALHLKDGLVQLALRADRAQIGRMERVAAEAAALLRRQPGVLNASVVLTAHRPPTPPELTAPPGIRRGHGEDPAGAKFLPTVRHVIAVASGKGGVGKSTVALNLAAALAAQGLRVGLIDADIHGPSLARMLGVTSQPETAGKMMQPIRAHGLETMSMAYLVPETQAMIWRGPMVMGALQQLLGQTEWGPLDAMIIDLPPGTGDAQLTLAQRVTLAGAVIVSTPQDLALIDARRGVAMFEKVGVRILGIVENMSTFTCPNCGHESHIFAHGGARIEALRLAVPFLGEIPLLQDVRAAGDAGEPIVLAAPDGKAALAFKALAARVWESVRK